MMVLQTDRPNCQQTFDRIEKSGDGPTTGNGVGSAIDAGHQAMLRSLSEPFVSVVMAGDGQMDPDDLELLIEPVTKNQADYVKEIDSFIKTVLAICLLCVKSQV